MALVFKKVHPPNVFVHPEVNLIKSKSYSPNTGTSYLHSRTLKNHIQSGKIVSFILLISATTIGNNKKCNEQVRFNWKTCSKKLKSFHVYRFGVCVLVCLNFIHERISRDYSIKISVGRCFETMNIAYNERAWNYCELFRIDLWNWHTPRRVMAWFVLK